MYSNSCCSCSFEAEILKIGQSSHKMYSNNILNFEESTTILNACTKKSENLLNASRIYIYIYIYIHIYILLYILPININVYGPFLINMLDTIIRGEICCISSHH